MRGGHQGTRAPALCFCIVTSLTRRPKHRQLGFKTSDEALCSAAHAAKCAAKDAATTSASLGFRLAGAQGWELITSQAGPPGTTLRTAQYARWRAERDDCKRLTSVTLRQALRRFFSAAAVPPTCAAARAAAAAQHLARMRACMDQIRSMRLLGTSALVVFDAQPCDSPASAAATCGCGRGVRVHLVDFAHAFPVPGRDDNVCAALQALCSELQALIDELSSLTL